MDHPKLTKAAFQSGTSWNTFKLENADLPYDITPLSIHRNLKVFSNSYRVTSDFISLEDLICFELHLEEHPHRQKGKRKPKKDDEVKQKIYTIKVAVSIDDRVMFCNRILNAKFRELFEEVFEATELIPYDLVGSPPYELLLLYRQASNQVNDNCIALNKISLDSQTDISAQSKMSTHLEIGCSCRRCPKIRRLTSSINGFSLKVADEVVKDLQVDDIELEVIGPSVFEAYLKFAEANYIHDVPDWLTTCRRNGKTHSRIRYT